MCYSHKVSASEETEVQHLEPVNFISHLMPIHSVRNLAGTGGNRYDRQDSCVET